MPRKTQTRGNCLFCQKTLSRSGLSKHLQVCPQRREAIDAADRKPGREQPLFHLQVQDAWDSDYWLHLEMNGSATLADLDHYLRAVWLECCGHLSEFSAGGRRGAPIPMRTRSDRLFASGVSLTHIYDFGTSSETTIRVIGGRIGKSLTRYPLALMARNEPPVQPCMDCRKPAAWLCLECNYELDQPGTLCDRHAKDHPHSEYGEPLALVNSPRMGMCGYDGPAEPPY